MKKMYVFLSFLMLGLTSLVAQSVTFDDIDKIKTTMHQTDGSMEVTVTYDVGEGKVVSPNGISFHLRQLTSTWGPTADEPAAIMHTESAGTQSGTITVNIPLSGYRTTANLVDGEFHWLWILIKDADEVKAAEVSTQGITIVDPPEPGSITLNSPELYEGKYFIPGDTIKGITATYFAGVDAVCNYASFSIRLMPTGTDFGTVYTNPGNESGTTDAVDIIIPEDLKLSSELADGEFYQLFVFGEMKPTDGDAIYPGEGVGVNMIDIVETPSITFDDQTKYETTEYVSGGKMEVTVNYNAGTGNVINENGIKFWLRRLGGGNSDVIAFDASAAGQQSGTATVELDLLGLTPTDELPDGAWYWLWVTTNDNNNPSTGTTWNSSLKIIAMDPGVKYDDDAKYLDPAGFVSGSKMPVSVAFEVGEGNTVTDELNGAKFMLREMTSGWAVVKDYVADDESVVGSKNGVASAEIDLTGATATEDLPDGNFYFLFTRVKASDGTVYNKGLNPIIITPAPKTVLKYELYNTNDNSLVMELKEGSVINIATLGDQFNVRAVPMPDPFGDGYKCQLVLSGAEDHTQSEGVAPYALFGDVDGVYNPHTWAVGSYNLTSTPVMADGTADGNALSVNFEVVNEEVPDAEDIDRSGWTVIAVNSQAAANADKEFAIDGDMTTKWFTDWQDAEAKFPFNIDIDLGGEYEIAEFTYVPRQDEWGPNGTIVDFDFFVSNSSSNWGEPAASGSFDYPDWVEGGDKEPFKESKSIKLTVPKTGKFIRLVGKSAINENEQMGVTEIYAKGTMVPSGSVIIVEAEDTIAAGGEYQAAPGGPIGIYENENFSNGKAINWVNHDDWMDYTINVAVGGEYGVKYVAGSPSSDINAEFSLNGNVLGNSKLNTTGGWDDMQVHETDLVVALTPGTHTVRIRPNGETWQFNLDRFDLTLLSPAAIIVEAEDTIAAGGEYQAGPGGPIGIYENENFSNGKAINWVNNDDWMEYEITVAQGGDFAVSYIAGSPSSDINAEFSLNGTVLGNSKLNTTGGWDDMQLHETDLVVNIPAGTHTIRIRPNGETWQFNLDRFDLKPLGSSIPVTGVEIMPEDGEIFVGQMIQFTADISPSKASDTTVMWTVEKPAVISVDEDGMVTGVGAGMSKVYVTTNDGGFMDSAMVTVNAIVNVESIMLDPQAILVAKDAMKSINAMVMPEGATDKTVAWKSLDETIATVDDKGEVTGVAVGMTQVVAITNDGGFSDTTAVTVTETALEDMVDCSKLPTTVKQQLSYMVEVPYVTNTKSDIAVEFKKLSTNTWLGEGRVTVEAGTGTAMVEVLVFIGDGTELPTPGGDYVFRAALRDVDGSWDSNREVCDSEEVTVDPETSINSPSLANVSVYPNPANDVIYVSGLSSTTSVISVFNLQGALVLNANVVSGADAKLDITTLESGYYFVKISSGDKTKTFKISKR